MSTDYNSRDWMPSRAVEHFHVHADTSPAPAASQREVRMVHVIDVSDLNPAEAERIVASLRPGSDLYIPATR
jgi:hypothetical protein